jgi:hypothetical protein
MRITTAILALMLTTSLAHAKPRRHGHKAKPTTAAAERFITDCVIERTGPTDGITAKAALKLCTGIVRHDAKIAKSAERARKAVEACEQAIVDACVDAADGTETTTCEDDVLQAAFKVCR